MSCRRGRIRKAQLPDRPRPLIEIMLGHSPRGVTALYTHPFKDAYEGVEDALVSVFDVNEASTDGGFTTGNDETPPWRRFGRVRCDRASQPVQLLRNEDSLAQEHGAAVRCC